MTLINDSFEFDRDGDTIVMTVLTDLREFEFARIEEDTQEAVGLLEETPAKNIVIDFSQTEYFGSTALGCFMRLYKKSRFLGGHMAFCGISEGELEVLRTTRLDTLWPICDTLAEALSAVREESQCKTVG